MRPLVPLLAAALLIAAASAAMAHAALVKSDPADGAILDEAPRRLVLTFDEPVTPIILRLVDPAGRPVELPSAPTDEAIVVTPPPLGVGTSVLSWRVISADGHPVGGSVVFSVGRQSAVAAPPATGDIWARTGLWLSRAALYALLAFGVGGVFFRYWIVPEPPPETETRWPLIAFIGWGICAALLALGFHGLDVLALGPSAFIRAAVWRAALSTSYALTVGAMVVALLAALGALHRRARRGARILSLAALAIAGVAPALSGHASTAAPQFLMRPTVAIHVAAVIFWSGALIPLAGLIGTGNRLAIRALLRFGRVIPYALIPLLLSGAILATVQIERIDAAWSTDYGRLLLAKIATVLVLLAIAAWNRFRLTASVAGGDVARARSLLHAIGAEIILVLVIFAIVAGWRFTPPPRALHAAEALHLHLHGERLIADVKLSPARSGPVTISLSLMNGDFAPLEAQQVIVVLTSPGAGIEPIRRQATRTADGDWRLDTTLPAATDWTIRIAALVSDFEEVRVEGAFRVARAPP